jgi:hypothetical protein
MVWSLQTSPWVLFVQLILVPDSLNGTSSFCHQAISPLIGLILHFQPLATTPCRNAVLLLNLWATSLLELNLPFQLLSNKPLREILYVPCNLPASESSLHIYGLFCTCSAVSESSLHPVCAHSVWRDMICVSQ